MATTPDPQRPTPAGTFPIADPFLSAMLDDLQAAHDDATDPRVNPCPECPDGEVVDNAAAFSNAQATAAWCSAGCGWSA